MIQIQRTSPTKLQILNAIDGNRKDEKFLHILFSDFRLHGEWFEPSQKLLNFIANPDDLPGANPTFNKRSVSRAMIHLKQYVLHKQVEMGRILDASEIALGSDVSRATVIRLMNNRPPKRVDKKTIYGLCRFFGVNRGEPIPFLIYDPE